MADGDWFSGLMGGINNFFGGGSSTPSVPDFSESYRPSSIPTGDVGTGMSGVQADAPGYYSAFAGGGAPPGGGGDWLSKLSGGLDAIINPVGQVASTLSPLLGLGVKGMQLATGIQSQQQAAAQNKIQARDERALQSAANTEVGLGTPLAQFGQQGLLGGQLSPGQEAEIAKWKQQALAKYRDYFARAGIADSTMMQSVESQVAQDELILRQQLASGTYQAGLAGLQGGTGDLARLGLISGGAAGSAEQQERQLYQDIFSVLGRSGK